MKPLDESQIRELHKHMKEIIPEIWRNSEEPKAFFVEYARAIERAHGIEE